MKRDLALALRRGIMGQCPSCGEAKLFASFLKPVATCPHCGEHWADKRADDFPAYLVILILGHLLVPVVIAVNLKTDLPVWLQMIGWPLIAAVIALAMIQPAKGFVLGLLWAR